MKATKIKDQKTLDRSMSDFCLLENKHVELTTEMESRLQGIRDKYASRLEALATKSESVRFSIIEYARENRDTLFPLNRKSIRLTNGIVGYRQGRPSLHLQDGYSWNDVLEALQEEKADEFIRTKLDVDRSRLLSQHDDPKVKRLLNRIGVRVSVEEQFYVETK